MVYWKMRLLQNLKLLLRRTDCPIVFVSVVLFTVHLLSLSLVTLEIKTFKIKEKQSISCLFLFLPPSFVSLFTPQDKYD